MNNQDLVKALRCMSTAGDKERDCEHCPFYTVEHLPEDDAWSQCDCDAVGLAAADLIENQQRHIEALMQANDALRGAWVPVTKRLPENGERVLAYGIDRRVHDVKWSWQEDAWLGLTK